MLSCRDITQKANDYLEKDMSYSTRMGVKMHLLMCIHCRRYIKQLEITIKTLGKMKAPEIDVVSEQQISEVVELLKKQKGS